MENKPESHAASLGKTTVKAQKSIHTAYTEADSIRERGNILSAALNDGTWSGVGEIAKFLCVPASTISREIASTDIPSALWDMYADHSAVSLWHIRQFLKLKKEFGWAAIEQAAIAVTGKVMSTRPMARYDAFASQLYARANSLPQDTKTSRWIENVIVRNEGQGKVTLQFRDHGSMDEFLAEFNTAH